MFIMPTLFSYLVILEESFLVFWGRSINYDKVVYWDFRKLTFLNVFFSLFSQMQPALFFPGEELVYKNRQGYLIIKDNNF